MARCSTGRQPLLVTTAALSLGCAFASCAAPAANRAPSFRWPSGSPATLPEPDRAPVDGPGTSPSAHYAQEPAADADQALKQANNPLANMKALNFHDYAIRDVSGTDQSANTFWVRYAQPVKTGFGDWLLRASLPLSRVPTGMEESESGVGDANVFAAYLLDSGDPSVSYGIGPLVGLPTATEDETGTDQWSAGAAAVMFDASSSVFQYGSLVTYQHKIGGSDRVDDVNLLAVQPFGFLQLGDGLSFRSTGIWAFDLENGDYSVPIGAGLGKVVKAGHIVFNLFVEPQFTVLDEGVGQPEFQVFFGFNTQFLGD